MESTRSPPETVADTDTLPFNYLAIDGPIGVGKTTLVEKLVQRFEAVKVLSSVSRAAMYLQRGFRNSQSSSATSMVLILFTLPRGRSVDPRCL